MSPELLILKEYPYRLFGRLSGASGKMDPTCSYARKLASIVVSEEEYKLLLVRIRLFCSSFVIKVSWNLSEDAEESRTSSIVVIVACAEFVSQTINATTITRSLNPNIMPIILWNRPQCEG